MPKHATLDRVNVIVKDIKPVKIFYQLDKEHVVNYSSHSKQKSIGKVPKFHSRIHIRNRHAFVTGNRPGDQHFSLFYSLYYYQILVDFHSVKFLKWL